MMLKRDQPIMFSGDMVRAILDGTKCMTRRRALMPRREGAVAERPSIWQQLQPGDLLWVREAFRGARGYEIAGLSPTKWGNKPVWYPADGDPPGEAWGFLSKRVRQPRAMPRALSRITLRVTGTRKEYLCDISEGDAMAEGVAPCLIPPDGGSAPHVEGFRVLWESLHGPGAWARNPLVVVIGFEIEKRP